MKVKSREELKRTDYFSQTEVSIRYSITISFFAFNITLPRFLSYLGSVKTH